MIKQHSSYRTYDTFVETRIFFINSTLFKMVLLLNGYRYKATESASRQTRRGFLFVVEMFGRFSAFWRKFKFVVFAKPAYCAWWGSYQEKRVWLLVTGEMWRTIHCMWHVILDMWHIPHNKWHRPFILLFSFASIFQFFGVSATIRIHWEIHCLPDTGFFRIFHNTLNS